MLILLNLILFLLQTSGSTPIQLPFFTLERIVFVVALAVLAYGNFYQFKNNRSELIHQTDVRVIESQGQLLDTRATQLDECKKKCSDCQDGREAIETEYKALAGIVIHELLEFAIMKRAISALQLEIEILTTEAKRLKTENTQLKLNHERDM